MSVLQWNVKRLRISACLLLAAFIVLFLFWIQYNDLTWAGAYKEKPDMLDDFRHRSKGQAEKRKVQDPQVEKVLLEKGTVDMKAVANPSQDSIKENINDKVKLKREEIVLVPEKEVDLHEKQTVKAESSLIQTNLVMADSEDIKMKLLNQAQPKQFAIIHKDLEKTKFVPGRDLSNHWVPPYVPQEHYVFETKRLPNNKKWLPSIGNGHIATVVHSDSIFMNGLYNGAETKSHRARIPSIAAINITNISPSEPVQRTYSLDVVQGVYYETTITKSYEIIQRMYAHRTIPQLLVTEIELARLDPKQELKIYLSQNQGEKSEDIEFQEINSKRQRVVHKSGHVKTTESPSTPMSFVHLYYDEIPKVLPAPPGAEHCQWFFVASIGNDGNEVEQAYTQALELIRQNKLFTSHVEGWSTLWKKGRIDFDGSLWLSQATYGSMYYLLSSVPLKDEENGLISFVGLSPTGLAHGNTEDDYLGHVFWDQETWMYPPILMLHSNIGKTLLKTRIRTRLAAQKIATQNGFKGSQFPWESAVTGFETTPDPDCAKYEIHVNGDIALAVQQYIYMTNNVQFLNNEEGKYLALDVAKFWASRVHKNTTTNKYEVLGVMGPDEYHFNVNNSAYTNAICKLSLELGVYVSELLKLTPDPEWLEIIQNMYIPYDIKEKYHPEFDGYYHTSRGNSSKVKQADVVLLGFPLQEEMSVETRRNDLAIYAKATSLTGPSMTWSMYSIGWLELKDEERGEEMFMRNMAYIKKPFQIWTEVADGTGAINFMTGMGGFLQNLLFGYGGFRIQKDVLKFDPTLPPNTNSFNITGLDYMNAVFDFTVEKSSVTVVLKSVQEKSPVKFVLEILALKHKYDLVIDKPVSIHKEKASIIPVKLK